MAYSMLLLSSIDPDKDLQIYLKMDSILIHPWYYVKQIIKKYPGAINWENFIQNLPGTRSQVIQLIEHSIGKYLNIRCYHPYPIIHHKLDYKTCKKLMLGSIYSYHIGTYIWQYCYISDKDENLVRKHISRIVKNKGGTKDEIERIVYRNKCNYPGFKTTDKLVMNMLICCPYMAQLPWLVDIQKYNDSMSEECKMHLYANPRINKDLFQQYIESNSYTTIYTSVLVKHIRNMFRFRIKQGLGLELHYPECTGIQEDTVEWRVKLFELNIGLITSGILACNMLLINAIPGRHTQYLHVICEYDECIYPNKIEIGSRCMQINKEMLRTLLM